MPRSIGSFKVKSLFLMLLLLSAAVFNSTLFADKSLVIMTCAIPNAKPWDPSTIHEGLYGSEEAIIYVSKELAKLGYQVTVYAAPPKDSVYSAKEANPRFLPLGDDKDERYDIAIAWRLPQLGFMLRTRADNVYFWPHDTPVGNNCDLCVRSFNGVLWLSEWQRQEWIKANPIYAEYKTIFGNGIEVSSFPPIEQRSNPHSCIYASNYARGLWKLIEIWPEVRKRHGDATLDIYYGWQTWGLLTKEQEDDLKGRIEQLAEQGVSEHGLVGHEELNKAFAKASVWAYPTHYPEVFCITALRAQYNGALPVVIPEAALAETVQHGIRVPSADDYLEMLCNAMQQAEKLTLSDRQQMRSFIDEKYTWKRIAEGWHELFQRQTANKAIAKRQIAKEGPQIRAEETLEATNKTAAL